MSHGKAVVVTTQHRGVFFGYLADESGAPARLKMTAVRNCIYWEKSLHGFIGLATDGPTSGCRVGPAAGEMTLFDITAIVDATPDAVEKWEASPWS